MVVYHFNWQYHGTAMASDGNTEIYIVLYLGSVILVNGIPSKYLGILILIPYYTAYTYGRVLPQSFLYR